MPVICGWPGSRVLVTTICGLSPSMLRTAARGHEEVVVVKGAVEHGGAAVHDLSVPESGRRNTSSIGSSQGSSSDPASIERPQRFSSTE